MNLIKPHQMVFKLNMKSAAAAAAYCILRRYLMKIGAITMS